MQRPDLEIVPAFDGDHKFLFPDEVERLEELGYTVTPDKAGLDDDGTCLCRINFS